MTDLSKLTLHVEDDKGNLRKWTLAELRERLLANTPAPDTEPEPPIIPPVLPPDPKPEPPVEEPPVVEPPSPAPATDLVESQPVSSLSDKPWGLNRLQVIHPPYEDDWSLLSTELIVANAPGFPDETPEKLIAAGHNMPEVRWYIGNDAPGNIPPDANLFFEVTGDRWNPYRLPYDVLKASLFDIGLHLKSTLPLWNSVPENGLIAGRATVRECHFNLEYTFLEEHRDGNWQGDFQRWPDSVKDELYLNHHTRQNETFRQTYNRGGINALKEALHQKWRNIIGLSIQIINRHSYGLRAYYGDYYGIAPFHSVEDWSGNYALSDLFSTDVNDASRFSEANEYMNAGTLDLRGEQYVLEGNLRKLAGISHVYNYEWGVFMSRADYEAYTAPNAEKDIRYWQNRMLPKLSRAYDFALHSQLTDYVKENKRWPSYRVYLQTEPIYENSLWLFDDNYRDVGPWVPWAKNCKIPLHPEVAASLVYQARINYNGLFLWGAAPNIRADIPGGRLENTHPLVHQTGREGFQIALDEINQHRVFTPRTQRINQNIRIWNNDTRQYVSGDPSLLYRSKLPLIDGVYEPDRKRELYRVYYPFQHQLKNTPVRFKSPIDGQELNAVARGWYPTLYTRTSGQLQLT